MIAKNRKPATPSAPTFRCAVYTRKSTEDGLEQEFNSLDAQCDAGECYIKSQVAEGWQCLVDRYDDGGFTGGNMDRPALRRLLADIPPGNSPRSNSRANACSTPMNILTRSHSLGCGCLKTRAHSPTGR